MSARARAGLPRTARRAPTVSTRTRLASGRLVPVWRVAASRSESAVLDLSAQSLATHADLPSTAITRAADAATGTGASSDGKAPTDSAFNKAITTADKDFTGESRGTGTTSGAYTDTHGHYETNASGPMGNSALTGREGNIDNNPVAQAKQAAGQSIHDVHTGTGATNTGTHTTPAKTSGASEAGSEKKKGIFQKIKDALE